MTQNNLKTIILISLITFFCVIFIENKDYILAVLSISYIIMWAFMYKKINKKTRRK